MVGSPLDGEQKEYILAAMRSSHRLTRLLSDILDLSKIEAGKMALHAGRPVGTSRIPYIFHCQAPATQRQKDTEAYSLKSPSKYPLARG